MDAPAAMPRLHIGKVMIEESNRPGAGFFVIELYPHIHGEQTYRDDLNMSFTVGIVGKAAFPDITVSLCPLFNSRRPFGDWMPAGGSGRGHALRGIEAVSRWRVWAAAHLNQYREVFLNLYGL